MGEEAQRHHPRRGGCFCLSSECSHWGFGAEHLGRTLRSFIPNSQRREFSLKVEGRAITKDMGSKITGCAGRGSN
ncbi:hypothetical protein CIPAW_04G069900 [Carya illinoinensis]|uniref:Uncharacterized protein n=1 Tax=Carya illinoinensis TaxID=32201 RepID=A0A8T1QSC4_CARIL|nr:hypothetical protein CIPAW_04G069900 [Carya illinoinensis]KAG6657149.1 hypothetical protein CIPAW_04G069900 [Carya illinoinensis]